MGDSKDAVEKLGDLLAENSVRMLGETTPGGFVQFECLKCGEQFGASKVRTHECADFTGCN